jgi:hypothetical protein
MPNRNPPPALAYRLDDDETALARRHERRVPRTTPRLQPRLQQEAPSTAPPSAPPTAMKRVRKSSAGAHCGPPTVFAAVGDGFGSPRITCTLVNRRAVNTAPLASATAESRICGIFYRERIGRVSRTSLQSSIRCPAIGTTCYVQVNLKTRPGNCSRMTRVGR